MKTKLIFEKIIPSILRDQLNKDLNDYWEIYSKKCLANQDDLLTDEQIKFGKIIKEEQKKIYYEDINDSDDYPLTETTEDFLEGFKKYMIDKYTKNPPKPITQNQLDELKSKRRLAEKAKYNERAKSHKYDSRANGIIKVWESSNKEPKICKIMEITAFGDVILLDIKSNKEFKVESYDFEDLEKMSKMSKKELEEYFKQQDQEKIERTTLAKELETQKIVDFTKDAPYQSENKIILQLKYYSNGDSFEHLENFFEEYGYLNPDYKEQGPIIAQQTEESMDQFDSAADKIIDDEYDIHEKPFIATLNSEDFLMLRAYLKTKNYISISSTQSNFVEAINNKKLLKQIVSQKFDFSKFPPEVAEIMEAELEDIKNQVKDPLCGQNEEGMKEYDTSSKLYEELKEKAQKKSYSEDYSI